MSNNTWPSPSSLSRQLNSRLLLLLNSFLRYMSRLPPAFIPSFFHTSTRHTPSPTISTMTTPSSFQTFLVPHLRPLLPPPADPFPALIYLFRYHPTLPPPFLDHTLATITRQIAEHTGKSNPESRRLFIQTVNNAALEYFSTHWHQPQDFVRVNQNSLLQVQMNHASLISLTDSLSAGGVNELSMPDLQVLQQHSLPTIVFIYANYCSQCKSVRPIFNKVAATFANSEHMFVALNGPKSPDAKSHFHIRSYPTILTFTAKGESHFPGGGADIDYHNLCAFVRGEKLSTSPVDSDTEEEYEMESDAPATPRRSRPLEWRRMLREQGIDQLDVLVNERDRLLHPSILQISDDSDDDGCDPLDSYCAIPSPGISNSTDMSAMSTGSIRDGPPLCVLLGGGMGSGKTTAVNLISSTDYWQAHASSLVRVEADAFKLNDPLFQILQGVTSAAARIVHADSIAAAEELFLRAVNDRRDVLLDGTLSWCEYAEQTIAMLRDGEYVWRRGRGYWEDGQGKHEEYWLRAYKRAIKVEGYQVELVAVTAAPEIAVMRGVVRRIITGRGVAVQDQLRSHALFSQSFERYVELVDAVYLFDTSEGDDTTEQTIESQLVAVKSGRLFTNPDGGEEGLVVRKYEAYEEFLKKKSINVGARGMDEIYEKDDR